MRIAAVLAVLLVAGGTSAAAAQSVVRDVERAIHVMCPGSLGAIVIYQGRGVVIHVRPDPWKEGRWTPIGDGCYARPMTSATQRDLYEGVILRYCGWEAWRRRCIRL